MEKSIMGNLTDHEIQEMINQTEERMKENDHTLQNVSGTNSIYKKELATRNLLVVGCGDGGCNIASQIHEAVPETIVIAYNTSAKAMDKIYADIRILPTKEDGSGKVRTYSQDIFKKGSYNFLLKSVKEMVEKMSNLEYILVTSTTDGGTGGGVSPMVAKLIHDNVDIPVIMIGVYPSLKEDKTSMYNAIAWQSEIEKIGIPYMVLDNNAIDDTKTLVHSRVNETVAHAAEIINGKLYGETNISAIDNRDMLMLLNQIGGRISIYMTQDRPVLGTNLDDFLMDLIQNKCPEMIGPDHSRGIGLFLKGPADLIESTDTSLTKFKQQYGDVTAQYVHLEISNEVCISLVCTGSVAPHKRLAMMRQRYDDIQRMEDAAKAQNSTSSLMDGMGNPLGSTKTTKRESDELDLSALDL